MGPQELSRTVLVVDDSGVFGFTLSLEFRKHGWGVYCCGSGDEALRQFEEKHFDIVLADIFMPGMQGDELATRMLQIRPDARIILMSSMPRERLPPLPRGVAFLSKPVNVSTILQAFEKSQKSAGGHATASTPPPPPPSAPPR